MIAMVVIHKVIAQTDNNNVNNKMVVVKIRATVEIIVEDKT